jgi:fucose permease
MSLTRKNYIMLVLVVFVGFLIFGFSENIKGPAIPRIQQDLRLSELQLGLLLALNSLGYMLACSFTGLLSSKIGLKWVCLLTFGSMAISGVLIFYAQTAVFFMAAYFLMYVGNGMLEIGLAIISARIFTRNTGMLMNLAHFFYGLSSMVAPLIASYLISYRWFGAELGWRGMYLIVLALAIIPFVQSLFPKYPGQQQSQGERIPFKDYAKDPAAWLIVSVLSLGVVSELAIGSWLVNFLEKAYEWDTTAAAGMLSLFFLFFTLARLFLGVVVDRIGFVKSLIVLSGFSGVCSVGAIIAGEPGALLFALAGIGIAPIYPTVMALLAKRYPGGTDTAITFTVTIMGIMSVIGNFLIGVIIDVCKRLFTYSHDTQTGLIMGLQAGYLFIGLCAIACSVVSVQLLQYLKRHKQLL